MNRANCLKALGLASLLSFSTMGNQLRAEPVTYSNLDDIPSIVSKKYMDKKAKKEIKGFEFSSVVAIGERIILADNETRRIKSGIESEDDEEQALFELEIKGDKVKIRRAWKNSFISYRKGQYDDIEGLALRDNGEKGKTLFMLGSHSLNKKGKVREERHVMVRLELDKDGEYMSLPKFCRSLTDPIHNQLREILKQSGMTEPKIEDELPKLNMEGLAVDLATGHLLIGLRAPLAEGKAIVLKLKNPDAIFDDETKPLVELHSLLDLNGHGIAALDENAGDGEYFVAASPKKEGSFKDYSSLWKGKLDSKSQLTELMRFQGHKLEGITRISSNGKLNGKWVLAFDEEDEDAQFGHVIIMK